MELDAVLKTLFYLLHHQEFSKYLKKLYSLGFNIGKETTKTNSNNVKISGIKFREQIVTLRHIKH